MNQTKIIAFYLPQYHCIPENDEWWGKGFTEWINVKKAISLFPGHDQPRVPLNQYYYNLLDVNVLKKQADLAIKYNVNGFCFYHYWFRGKLLLHKPVELLLNSPDVKIPYCFCWANEPWTRSWDGTNRKVIMPQEYGGQEDWKQHFEYFVPYFKDERYIKIDGKPLLILYKSQNIKQCDEMIAYWNQLCKEVGLSGIFVAEEVNGVQFHSICTNSNAVVEFEPGYTMNNYHRYLLFAKKIFRGFKRDMFKKTIYYSYDFIWKKIVSRNNEYKNKERYLGAFVDWDNSPRRGKRGIIFKGVSMEKFEKYFLQQYQKSLKNNDRFLFINAWNEWAEGTYLEPDETSHYSKLEIIQKITSNYEIGTEEISS